LAWDKEYPRAAALNPSSIGVVTDFRQDAASILNRLEQSGETCVITRRGRAAAVMQSVEAYDRAEHEREILYQLALGEAEIREGAGFSLDEVLREADEILSRT
jgi:prevent-host-death family protein